MNKECVVDWNEWSKEAANAMMVRNQAWQAQYGLAGAKAHWDLGNASLTFETPEKNVTATVCLVGTSAESSQNFLWSWANEAVPPQHGQALAAVHEFGRTHGLTLLTTPEIPGGQPEALECLSIAAKLQHAVGTYWEQVGEVGLYFTILHFHAQRH